MQGAYGGTSSSGTAAATTNVFSSSDANGMASTTSSTSSTGESEYYRDIEHGTTTNTENKAYIKFKDPIVQKAKERQITDEHYYKVVLVTDREKTKVVGPEGFGEVTYPFPWRYQGKQMSVGPWDCQPAGEVLSVKQCCDKIVNSVPCPDDLGNCMSCHVQPGYVQGKDRVITQPDTLNVDTYNEFHYDDSSSNGDMLARPSSAATSMVQTLAVLAQVLKLLPRRQWLQINSNSSQGLPMSSRPIPACHKLRQMAGCPEINTNSHREDTTPVLVTAITFPEATSIP